MFQKWKKANFLAAKCNNIGGPSSAAVMPLAVSAPSRLLMALFCSTNRLMPRSQSAKPHRRVS